MGIDQAPESRFGLRFSMCGVLDLCHVRNVKKLDQVNCAKFTYIQSNRVDVGGNKFWWKKFGRNFLQNFFGGKCSVEFFGGKFFGRKFLVEN